MFILPVARAVSAGWNGFVGRNDEKVLQPFLAGGQDGGGHRGSGGLEPDPQEDHPLGRIVAGQGQRIEGGVNNAYIGAVGFFALQG